jgi:hypothetical protein
MRGRRRVGDGRDSARLDWRRRLGPEHEQPLSLAQTHDAGYSISQDDLGPGYITDIPATFVLDVQNYGKTATFSSEQEGQDLLTKWGYLGGYETGYSPEGRDVAVLNGAYYIKVEVHLFKDETGAKKAFDYFENRLRQAQSAQPVTAAQLGNQSSAWRTVFGKVPNSSVDAAYHRIVFRRGNLVSVVLTYGADPFMKVDTVRSLAVMVDQKALGEKTATEPTPVSSFVTPTPSSSGASPTASH